jgi:hypothetical protein
MGYVWVIYGLSYFVVLKWYGDDTVVKRSKSLGKAHQYEVLKVPERGILSNANTSQNNKPYRKLILL